MVFLGDCEQSKRPIEQLSIYFAAETLELPNQYLKFFPREKNGQTIEETWELRSTNPLFELFQGQKMVCVESKKQMRENAHYPCN